ncbi:MAG TPA: PKD domain-containing protein [Candidatus Sumerlaeota bacterium]|nr:PKD domain-containing protein [Candidatus Sumerlaeota bacterium]
MPLEVPFQKNTPQPLLFKTLFLLVILTLTGSGFPALAEKVGYRDGEGVWRIIEDTDWPAIPPDKQYLTETVATRAAKGVTFSVTYLDVVQGTGKGFNDPSLGATRRSTVQAVLNYIGSQLNETGSCQIEFEVSQTDGSGALAEGGPFFSTANTFEPPFPLQHITTGTDPSLKNPDLTVTVDFGWAWHNDTSTPVPSNQIDLYSVLLHEITHGLGIISLTKSNGSSEFSPSVVYSTFDNFLYTGNGTKLWNSSGVFQTSAASLTGSNGGVVFRGPQAKAQYGSYPPVYTPSPWSSGSSISHWINTLSGSPVMKHAIGYGVAVRTYAPFELKALADLGYTLPVVVVTPVANFKSNLQSGVVPLTVSFTDLSTNQPTSWAWDFQDDGVVDSTSQNPTFTYSAPGVYSVRLTVRNTAGSDSLQKQNLVTVVKPTQPVLLVY